MQSILTIKVSVSIGTMFNLDGDFGQNGDGGVTCKQSFNVVLQKTTVICNGSFTPAIANTILFYELNMNHNCKNECTIHFEPNGNHNRIINHRCEST